MYTRVEVEAIARNEAGEVIAKDQVEKQPASLRVSRLIERRKRDCGRRRDLTYITAMKSSMKQVVFSTANNLVHFHLHGQGQIVGVDNGNKPAVNATKRRKMAHGTQSLQRQRVVIVKSTEQGGCLYSVCRLRSLAIRPSQPLYR